MFINLLRGLHPKEVELLILVKDKDLTSKYKITHEIVKQKIILTLLGRSFMTVQLEKEETYGRKFLSRETNR